MSKAIEARIEALVAPIVSCADLFLESVTVTRGKEPLVRVTVDLRRARVRLMRTASCRSRGKSRRSWMRTIRLKVPTR